MLDTLDRLPVCPHCGQPLQRRYGVHLPPATARIFDLIERAGRVGITSAALALRAYPAMRPRQAQRNIIVQIHTANALLAATTLRIRSSGRGEPYRLVREVPP
jgi:hypothetical protein